MSDFSGKTNISKKIPNKSIKMLPNWEPLRNTVEQQTFWSCKVLLGSSFRLRGVSILALTCWRMMQPSLNLLHLLHYACIQSRQLRQKPWAATRHISRCSHLQENQPAGSFLPRPLASFCFMNVKWQSWINHLLFAWEHLILSFLLSWIPS